MKNNDKILKWLEEAEPSSQSSSEERPRKSYDKKIVGWLDILGIREKIKDEKNYDAESIIEIMSTLSLYVSTACDKFSSEDTMNYLQIADGFMIVADLSKANEVCSILAEIQWKILINLKMLSRGAITAGNVSVSHNGNLIIGPAYVDAYAMESENAIYSRIIISDDFIEETKEYYKFKYSKEDSDAIIYIDYINYIMDTQLIDGKRLKKMLVEQGVIKSIKRQFNTKSGKKLSVRQKHGWTMNLLKSNNISVD